MIRVMITHTINKSTTPHGNYKILNNALKSAKKTKEYYNSNNKYWMQVWIGSGNK